MKSNVRKCPDCGTTYLVKARCTFCYPNNSRQEEAPKKTKETVETGAREVETRANKKTTRSSADRIEQMGLF